MEEMEGILWCALQEMEAARKALKKQDPAKAERTLAEFCEKLSDYLSSIPR